jgi:predicted PurR-regulated permease PerM
MSITNFRNAFLVLLVVAMSVAFIAMIRAFLLTILMAALFTGIAYPLYRRIVRAFGGRYRLAALATLLVLLVVVIAPLLSILGVAAAEAVRVNETLLPRLQAMVDEPGELDRRLQSLPGYEYIAPYRDQIVINAREFAGTAGAFALDVLSATTRATVLFMFHFIVMLYTMYFFLTDGPRLVAVITAYLPLTEADKRRMLETFVSVARATLKGTVLIGMAQGGLAGLAFWAVGIDGAVFWATIMTVLSIIPGIGAALIWVPAAIILFAMGSIWQAIALTLFCALVVGSIDNLLRPVLVGRDTQMHELLIFFSTLGGLMLFGAVGFILGPILAALFVTAWEMFGTAFERELAEPAPGTTAARSLHS